MELRVWVDGTQRVVCGVKLTTTCQEIVFALAHAIQQAGRFTMVERWGTNERLLSPNEQPLVTLQRYGDRMNEVEFILRKTSTDFNPQQQQTQNQQQRQSQTQLVQNGVKREQVALNDRSQLLNNSGQRESPISSGSKASSQQHLNEQNFDSIHNHNVYNLNRRPQTVLGSLTGSNSSVGLGNNYFNDNQYPVNSTMMGNFRSSTSVSTLSDVGNGIGKTNPSTNLSGSRLQYADDQELSSNNSSVMRLSHNGYPSKSETHNQATNIASDQVSQISKNYPFEDLYSTVNKKPTNQPPAVPAKPRVINPYVTNMNLALQQLPTVHNAQLNYHYQRNRSPIGMYTKNLVRPRHPPGYMEYIEAMSNRNSLPQPMVSNSMFARRGVSQTQSNMYPRSFDGQQVHNMQVNGSSPVSPSIIPNNGTCGTGPGFIPVGMQPSINRYRYSYNGQSNLDDHEKSSQNMQTNAQVSTNLSSDQLVSINRPTSNASDPSKADQANVNNPSITARLSSNEQTDDLSQSLRSTGSSSMSQMGHDMLRVIEEQKKVLLNQKNELDLLDNDREYRETKQNSEQVELINRIEKEIQQLEDLWQENQLQIKRLENQDLERELLDLKSEQLKMKSEIERQKGKLTRCEDDINLCKTKIERLEFEVQKKDVSYVSDEELESHDDVEVNAAVAAVKSLRIAPGEVGNEKKGRDADKASSREQPSSNGVAGLLNTSESEPISSITPPSSNGSPISSKDEEPVKIQAPNSEPLHQTSKVNTIDLNTAKSDQMTNNNNSTTANQGGGKNNNLISQLQTIETI